jgi:aldose sugar dehydrogenase
MRVDAPRKGARPHRLVALLVALLVAGAAMPVVPATPVAAQARAALRPVVGVGTHVSGLNRPWDLAFTPDGTLLFTLKSGEINARRNGATIVMGDPSDVLLAGEGGMMGLAVDPGFATNRRIYTCMLSRANGRPDDVRVVRWRVADDYQSLSLRTDIVTGIDVNTDGQLGRHSGCRPRFGPDGNLWIGTGDAATPTHPQDPDSLAGKVLRVDTDGDGVSGNAGPPFRPEIFSFGHRNIQGIAFRPSDGKPYSVEHGTSVDDEVNALVAGANYGWDPVNPGDPDDYDESQPMTDLVKFPDAHLPVWSSGDHTIATSGAVFVSGSQWLAWDDSLAIATLKGERLVVLTLDESGDDVVATTERISDRGRLRSIVRGPSGDLYLTQDSPTAAILRLRPNPACTATSPRPFPDVPGTNAFCREIFWGEQEEIVGGYADGTFRPTRPVTRQAFANMLWRFDHRGGFGGPPAFSDVATTHAFYEPIQWLADNEIADGFADGTFRPTGLVTRQAVASMLYRYAGSPNLTTPTAAGTGRATFSDVPPDHPFHDAIEWLAAQGYVTGFGDGTFRPGDEVTRQAAVAVLYRAEEIRPPSDLLS